MKSRRRTCVLILFVLLFSAVSLGQRERAFNRIVLPIDESQRTILRGNTHPSARRDFDVGTASPDLPLNRMLLVLKRDHQQEVALRQLLDDQQTRTSTRYHEWLTPEQFGSQFGPSEGDIDNVISWLRLHGFQDISPSVGRTVIAFSGSAAQVKEAFHTSIHRYIVNGGGHWANSSDPEIPSAVAPVVAGVVSLHDFGRQALHRLVEPSSTWVSRMEQFIPSSPGQSSLLTNGSNCGPFNIPCNWVTPYDFATIYNLLPLWNSTSPIDGTGVEIAIVGQSDIYSQDFTDFRKDFGLPAGTLNIIYNGPPPVKLASQGDELESDLDVEWSGAVAKGATIDLVASTSTNTTAGVDLSALYIVDNNLAPVMSESYGACELAMGTAGNLFYSQLWQQAAAQGITVFVSTGDSGSAVCDQNGPYSTYGLSVNGISSTPYNIAVGGTDFDDAQNTSQYWSSSNTSKHASAKAYVPEAAWNDTCTNSEFLAITGKTDSESDCNDYNSQFWPAFVIPVGGSGGASNCIVSDGQSVSSCTGGYPKPNWQSNSGVPADGVRDVPDVSLFAGAGLNASSYLVCETDIYNGCAGQIDTLVPVGGTSASSPAFAGIMAMIVQLTQSRQGNANYVFYPLAAQTGATCDSTGSVPSSCIFHDITKGTIAMACSPGTPDCVTNVVGDQVGVLTGFNTGAGFDLATGLGTVNAANLANSWTSVSFQPTISTLSLAPTQITHGSSVNINVTVAGKSGTGVPTGQVSILTSNGPPVGTFALTNGSVSSTTTLLPGGTHTVTAHYAGDGTFGASDSAPISVNVSAEPSVTTVKAFTLDQNDNQTPFTTGPYGGNIVYIGASVAGQSGQGVATGKVNLTQTLNGTTTPFSGNPYTLNSDALTMVPFPGYNYWAYAPGTYTMAAAYSGDSSFKPSNSTGVTFTVTPAQTNVSTSILNCTPGSTPCLFGAGNSIQIFASVNYSGGAFNKGGVFISQPTGTITFYSNGTALGAPVPVDSSIAPPVASFGTNQMPLGLDNITAQYSGDGNFSGSTSPSTAINVGGSVAVAANSTTITIAKPGESGSATLTFSSQNGLTGTFPLTADMCMGLPPQSTCSFSPSSVVFTSSTTSVPVTLTIATTGSSSKAFSSHLASSRGPNLWPFVVPLSLGLFALPLGFRRNQGRKLGDLILFGVIIVAVACGGGSPGAGSGGGGGGGGGGVNSGTPAGTYPVTLQFGFAGPVQFVYVTVNVQ